MTLLDRLLGWVTRHPVWVIAAVALLSALSVLGLRRLRLGESPKIGLGPQETRVLPQQRGPGAVADLHAEQRARKHVTEARERRQAAISSRRAWFFRSV